MVETSVAVATPSTTAERMTTGRPRPGMATSSSRNAAAGLLLNTGSAGRVTVYAVGPSTACANIGATVVKGPAVLPAYCTASTLGVAVLELPRYRLRLVGAYPVQSTLKASHELLAT